MVLDTQGKVEEADGYLKRVGSDALVMERHGTEGRGCLVRRDPRPLENDPLHPTAHADLALTLWRVGRVEEVGPISKSVEPRTKQSTGSSRCCSIFVAKATPQERFRC